MSGPIHYGPQFAVIRDNALDENAITVLFSQEIKKICREDKVCFLKFENGEELPFFITTRDTLYSPPGREIFKVGRYGPGYGAIEFVNEIELGGLNSGNLTLKHFFDLYEEYSLCLSKCESYEQVGKFIDFVEKKEKSDWKHMIGEESFDEDFYTRYGRGRFSTEPNTGFRENLFRKTETDKGTGVIFGYVHKEFGDEKNAQGPRKKNTLKLRGKNGEDVFFEVNTNNNNIDRLVRASNKTCSLYTREEFMDRLLVAENFITKTADFQKFSTILRS